MRRLIDGLRPSGYSATERVLALEKLSGPLSLAFSRAASVSPERARTVAALLVVDPGQLPFAPLTANVEFTPAERARLEALARELGVALLPTFATLARHPSPDVRLFALRFLGHRAEPAAKAAVDGALKDELGAVRRAALATLDASDPQSASAVIALLEVEPDWALRALAAENAGACCRRQRERSGGGRAQPTRQQGRLRLGARVGTPGLGFGSIRRPPSACLR